jgi:hypothetical protein
MIPPLQTWMTPSDERVPAQLDCEFRTYVPLTVTAYTATKDLEVRSRLWVAEMFLTRPYHDGLIPVAQSIIRGKSDTNLRHRS